MAVVMVLTTVVLVTLSGDNDQDRIERAADVLHRLAAALDTTRVGAPNPTSPSFVGQVTKYPQRLSHLYTHIQAIDLQCNSPGLAVKQYSANASTWKGPYYLVPIPTTGYQIAPGFVANDLLHVGPPTGAPDTLAIEIPNVSLADAKLLELFVDRNGISDGTGNWVKYSPRDGTTPVTVEYVIFSLSRPGYAGGCT